MPVRIFDENNWSNMQVVYSQDSDLNTNQQTIYSDSCLNFVYPEFFNQVYDQKNNNYSNLVLTSGLRLQNAFSLQNPQEAGNGFVTYISNGIGSIKDTAQRFWAISSSVSGHFLNISTENYFAGKNSDYYFEIDFLPDNTCRISHEYYNSKYYLNLNFLDSKVYMVSSTSDIFAPNSLYHQSFEYIFDKKNNCMAFFYRKNNNVYTVVRQGSSLGFSALTGSNIQFTIDNTFNVLPIKFSYINTLSSFWFNYTKAFDTNNLNVDCAKTATPKDQIVFHSEYNNIISPEIPYNFFSNKNSLTPNSENVSFRENKNIREYVALNTGSKQEKGNLKLSQNYLSKINEYVFSPGKLTYFHTPLDMGEYNFLNVNDSFLVEAGSNYSNTPEFSDKIWKKLSNYNRTSKFGNPRGEINGTWVCSWLSGSTNPDDHPVWYDRYYVPGKTTRQEAFSANQVYSYESHYDCITEQANSPDCIFDVKSELTFEPYTLYAYYRTGKEDVQEFINKNNNVILFDGIGQYLGTNGTVFASDNGNYAFDGYRYGVCETINSKNFQNNFSILFSLNSKDFSKPFGHELFGNQKNSGIGIYSDRSVTPFLRIINGKNLNIYNTDLVLLDSLSFNNDLIDVVQLESLDDYFVLDKTGELYQINSQNTIFDSTQYNLLSSTISHFSDEVYTFFLISTGGDVVSYNRKTEQIGYNDFPRIFSSTPMNNAQSLKRIGSGIYVMDGKQAQIREGSRLFYNKNNEIVEWNITTNQIETRFYNSSGGIVSYQMDDNLNFYIFDNYSTCYVFNSSGFVLTKFAVPSSGKVIASDYSSMYREGNKQSTIYAICSAANNSGIISFIDCDTLQPRLNPNEIEVEYASFNYSLSSCERIPISNTDYNHEILDMEYPGHTISIRLTLPNVYPSFESDEINLKLNASQLNYGPHEFAFTFDSVEGTARFVVDGEIVDTKTFDKAKYTLSEIITEPLFFGSTCYFGGINLFSKLKQDNSFTISNVTMRDIYFFTKSFDYYTIRFLQKLSKNIQSLHFNLPSLQRNYTDAVDKFFRQRLPYRKSSSVDISINNSKITDSTAKAYVQSQLNQILLNNFPYMTDIKNLVWRENI